MLATIRLNASLRSRSRRQGTPRTQPRVSATSSTIMSAAVERTRRSWHAWQAACSAQTAVFAEIDSIIASHFGFAMTDEAILRIKVLEATANQLVRQNMDSKAVLRRAVRNQRRVQGRPSRRSQLDGDS